MKHLVVAAALLVVAVGGFMLTQGGSGGGDVLAERDAFFAGEDLYAGSLGMHWRDHRHFAGTHEHGGGDPLMQQHIFSEPSPADPFRRSAGHEQGAASVLVGIAANQSMAEGRPVNIGQLVALRPEATRLSELV